MEISEAALLPLLGKGNERAFEYVFKTYFKSLHTYAFSIVKDGDSAEEMVQNVFFNIWKRRERLNIEGSLKAYLYRSVHNECMNFLKHRQVREAYAARAVSQESQESPPASTILQHRELGEGIRAALNELPTQCRIIFQLSRFEELRYKDIAQQLGISVKTVENQMGKALKLLRLKLADYLAIPIGFMLELLMEGLR